jgi:anti-anti-sigma factor
MSQIPRMRCAPNLRTTNAPRFSAEMLADADRITVTARGQLDHHTQPVLALTLAKAIATDRREVVIDLDGVDSIDPEDVGLLMRTRSLLQSRGQHLVVRSPRANAEVRAACALLDPFERFGHANERTSDAPAVVDR